LPGFALHNDYSERGFPNGSRRAMVQRQRAPTAFAPFGPFLATVDEVPNFAHLPMWLDVNGGASKQSNTSNMNLDVPSWSGYVSQFMTLLPGDVISTGTPAGVGLGQNHRSTCTRATSLRGEWKDSVQAQQRAATRE